MRLRPAHLIDFYKSGHLYQYPNDVEVVFSNLTPRMSRLPGVDKVVFYGLQYFIKEYLVEKFNKNFFDIPWRIIESEYKDRMDFALGEDIVKVDHIRELHDLQYLPICIKAVAEGSRVDLRVPCMVIYNTDKRFYWLTNYFETMLSASVWGMCTSATMALEYKTILNDYADRTVGNRDFVQFQGHDFSMRGMFGIEASIMSGSAHLTSFVGTDTVPAIDFLEDYYGANCREELIGCSVPATEHAVMCLHGDADERGTINELITQRYPSGIISIVSDTWDFWEVITQHLPALYDNIMARNGKVVVRPDSGDPADIICGTARGQGGEWQTPEHKGAIECLWETFGGTVNEKGYKELDSHIGLIYGDSITLDRCRDICKRLEAKGFASTNVVFGIGSYTYQYTTRDTYGFAVKATYAEVDGEPREIFKKPKTDNGMKNSAKGLTAVWQGSDGDFELHDQTDWDEVSNCALQTVFENGKEYNTQTLDDVRQTILRSS